MSKQLKVARRSAGEIASLEAEIAQLKEKRRALGAAFAAQQQDLWLSAAQAAGLLERLSPDELVGAIKAIAASAGKPEHAAEAAATAVLQSIGPEDRVSIEVKFGNHRSPNVERLRKVGLARDGRRGVWHGEVDAPTWTDLAALFGPKLKILVVHPGDIGAKSPNDLPTNDTAISEKQSTAMPGEPVSEILDEPRPTPSAEEENSVKPSSPFRGMAPRNFKK